MSLFHKTLTDSDIKKSLCMHFDIIKPTEVSYMSDLLSPSMKAKMKCDVLKSMDYNRGYFSLLSVSNLANA